MNLLSNNIMDILNSPDEGFLSMEDSSHQVAPMRIQHQYTSNNPICLNQITGPECNISGNVTQESENYILGVCGECIRPIMDQYYLAVDGQTWHLSCLRCAICNCDLQWQSSCFSYRGRLVCREDYRRRTECLVCERRFRREDRVHIFPDGRSFHCECLRCHQCGQEIQKSEGFFCLQKNILCLGCHQRPQKKKLSNGPSLDFPSNAASSNSLNTPNSNRAENENRCEQNQSVSGTSVSSENPRKRHRTSFKQTQLEIMKDYFRINQNPDKNELLQIAEKTGLKARILQVWFQNARANFRRRSSNKGGENVEATMSQNSSISGGTPVGDFESPNDY
ncbi:unnamed protein product [Hymenolepis diminuta]|uniref:Uncharacterized protein n=1 Tax=Hymenolepis diminuta TaxID=6216 RepID=A0A564YRC7_HYMDI|nr:unnamed protein product [Hymenolepis diminuta]